MGHCQCRSASFLPVRYLFCLPAMLQQVATIQELPKVLAIKAWVGPMYHINGFVTLFGSCSIPVVNCCHCGCVTCHLNCFYTLVAVVHEAHAF